MDVGQRREVVFLVLIVSDGRRETDWFFRYDDQCRFWIIRWMLVAVSVTLKTTVTGSSSLSFQIWPHAAKKRVPERSRKTVTVNCDL